MEPPAQRRPLPAARRNGRDVLSGETRWPGVRHRGRWYVACCLHRVVSPSRPGGSLDPARARRSFCLVEETVGRYFRVQVLGAEHIPTGRALVIGRHSGVLPWDAACLVPALYRCTGRIPRSAGHAFWGRWRPVARYLEARGVVLGPAAELETLLRREELVLLFPGGAADMRLPVWERYRVKAHKGFAPGRGGTSRSRCARRARSSRWPSSGPRRCTCCSPTSGRSRASSASPTSRSSLRCCLSRRASTCGSGRRSASTRRPTQRPIRPSSTA